jgi:hypothetical protein
VLTLWHSLTAGNYFTARELAARLRWVVMKRARANRVNAPRTGWRPYLCRDWRAQ